MNDKGLLAALGRLKVETGSLACMGCGYEQNCGVHGCAVLRAAEKRLRELLRPSSSASAPAGAEKQTAQDMVTAAAGLSGKSRDAGDGVCGHLHGYPQAGGVGDHGQAPQRHGVQRS